MSINEFSSAANDETNAVLADALNEALGLDPVMHDMFKADALPIKYPQEERELSGMTDFASMLRSMR